MTDASYTDNQNGQDSGNQPPPDQPVGGRAPTAQSSPPPLVGPGGYGLPPGMQQVAGISPGMMYPRGRQSDQWGQPDPALQSAQSYPGVDPSPWMPRPGLDSTHGALQQMGRMPWSAPVGMSASASIYYQAAYLRALRQNRMQDAELAIRQRNAAWEDWQRKQAKELQEQHEIMSTYGAMKDKPDASGHTRLWYALSEYAAKNGDHYMQVMLQNHPNPHEAALTLINDRDQTWLTGSKVFAQNAKNRDDIYDPSRSDEEQAPSEQQPEPSTLRQPPADGQPPGDDGTNAPATQPSAPAAPTTAPPSGGGGGTSPGVTGAGGGDTDGGGGGSAPGTPAVARPPNAGSGSTGITDSAGTAATTVGTQAHPSPIQDSPGADTDTSGMGSNSHYTQAGRDLFNGQTRMPGKAGQFQQQAADQIAAKMRHVINTPGLTPQQYADRMRAIDSTFGNRAVDIAEYNADLPPGAARGLGALQGMYIAAAKRINPKYSQMNYKELQKYLNENGQGWQMFLGAAAARESLVAAIKDIKDIQRTNPNLQTNWGAIIDRINRGLMGTQPGDQLYAQFDQDMRAFAQEAVRAATGKFPVTPYSDVLARLTNKATVPTVIAGLTGEIRVIDSRVEEANRDYRNLRNTGQDAPNYNPAAHQVYDVFLRPGFNSFTSTVDLPPNQIPSELKGIVFSRPKDIDVNRPMIYNDDTGQYGYYDKQGNRKPFPDQ